MTEEITAKKMIASVTRLLFNVDQGKELYSIEVGPLESNPDKLMVIVEWLADDEIKKGAFLVSQDTMNIWKQAGDDVLARKLMLFVRKSIRSVVQQEERLIN